MTAATHVRFRDSLVPAVINAGSNGAIAYHGFKAEAAVPMTLDLISSTQHTVWGQGVTLAFALGISRSIVTGKVFARHRAGRDGLPPA